MPDSAESLPEELAERWQALGAEVRRRLGPGARIESRRAFEGLLGAELNHVLVHRSPFAARVAASAQAEALTAGSRVLGAAAQLDESTRRGRALLAHEATHALHAPPATAPAPSATPAMAAPPAPQAVQRDESGESAAQAVEAAVLGADATRDRPSRQVDPEALADLVYRRLRDDLLHERERMAWPA